MKRICFIFFSLVYVSVPFATFAAETSSTVITPDVSSDIPVVVDISTTTMSVSDNAIPEEVVTSTDEEVPSINIEDAAPLTVSNAAVVIPSESPNCSAQGLFGTYYNLPKNHPDIETTVTGVIPGTSPADHDWWDSRYFAFSRNDTLSALNVPSGFFPVDQGLEGDPFYFAVHWTGVLTVPASGTYPVTLSSDDDGWLYVNGAEVTNLGGVHSLRSTSTLLVLPAGTSSIDIYFAERHTVASGIEFLLPEGLAVSPCAPSVNSTSTENHPPMVTGPASATTTVSSTLTFTVSSTDPDNDSLTITTSLPLGATYSTSTGEFAWTPDVVGTSTAMFSASDGKATSTLVVALEVFDIATSTTATSTENGGGSGGGSSGGGGGGGGCGGCGMNPSGILTTDVFLTSTSHTTSTTSAAPVSVGGGGGAVNLPPYFVNFNPPIVTQAQNLYFYIVEARDPENDPLTFRFLDAPLGMVIGTSTGAIIWIPTYAQVRTAPYDVTVEVSDGQHATSTHYMITVNAPANTTAPLQPQIPTGNGVLRGEAPPTPLPQEEHISTTTEARATASAGGSSFPALLLAGLFSVVGPVWKWIIDNWCILGWLLFIFTLLAFLFHLASHKKDDGGEGESVVAVDDEGVIPDHENALLDAEALYPDVDGDALIEEA